MTFEQGLPWLKVKVIEIFTASKIIWVLAFIGLFSGTWDREVRSHQVFLIGLTIFSILAVCSGWYFRSHYWILLLPAAALMTSSAVFSIYGLLRGKLRAFAVKGILVSLVGAALILPVLKQKKYLFESTPFQACRITYGVNPFPEAVEIGSYIRANTNETDRILILGSEPEIFFYADRLSTTKHIYMYDLMNGTALASEFQNQVIADAETNNPEYIIFININASWLFSPNFNRKLFDWFDVFQRKYIIDGIYDIYPNGSVFIVGEKARIQKPKSVQHIYILKRRNNSEKPQ